MAVKRYSEDTKFRARLLYESGVTYREIAQELKIGRLITIYDWKKRYGWKRSQERVSKHEAIIWQKVRLIALGFLETVKFKSPLEAVRAIEIANKHLTSFDSTLKDSVKDADDEDKVLSLLKKDSEK